MEYNNEELKEINKHSTKHKTKKCKATNQNNLVSVHYLFRMEKGGNTHTIDGGQQTMNPVSFMPTQTHKCTINKSSNLHIKGHKLVYWEQSNHEVWICCIIVI